MDYLAVKWDQPSSEMPVEILSELDGRRFETRKIEYFRNGTVGFASAGVSDGRTRLAPAPVPTLAEIALQPEFQARRIPREEFERAWAKIVRMPKP